MKKNRWAFILGLGLLLVLTTALMWNWTTLMVATYRYMDWNSKGPWMMRAFQSENEEQAAKALIVLQKNGYYGAVKDQDYYFGWVVRLHFNNGGQAEKAQAYIKKLVINGERAFDDVQCTLVGP